MLSTLRKIEKLRVMRRILDGQPYVRTWLHSEDLYGVFEEVWNAGSSEVITTKYKLLRDDCIEWRTEIAFVEKMVDLVRVKCKDRSVWIPRLSVSKRVNADVLHILEVL